MCIYLERQLFGALALLICLAVMPARAVTVVWTGGSNNDWSVSNNWNPTQTPIAGDDVTIGSGSPLLTNATPWLSSFTIANATLTFANWSTRLSAGNVTIRAGGTLTLPAAFTNNAMSNRVWIACSNVTIDIGGSIVVDGKGYAKGTSTRNGQGPGGAPIGQYGGGGAGYGGAGGSGWGGAAGSAYGSTNAPLTPGSGGGGCSEYAANGADGGGAALIEAAGAVVVNGTISANGSAGSFRGGGGSGGAVYITCNTFAGTNGIIRVNGGSASVTFAGAGGGGRIALVYDQTAQASLPKPRVRFSADRALGFNNALSDIGAIYFPDMALMDSSWMAHNGELNVPGFATWSVPSLLVTNGYIRIPSGNPFVLTVTNDLNIVGPTGIFRAVNGAITCGGNIAISGSGSALSLGTASALTNVQSLYCAGNVTMSTNTSLYVYSALTNAAQINCGALVDVAGDISIATNAWIYSYSHNTNGGSVLFRVRNLTIAAGGGISANGAGWRGGYNAIGWSVNGYGPGGGYAGNLDGSGGGYGGRGGRSSGVSSRGVTYGSSNAPSLPGSGGAGRTGYPGMTGGAGGGLVRIEALVSITIDGTITANGGTGSNGGGSGGCVYLRCLRFAGGSNGLLRANGANGADSDDGAGGGGRIAVWRVANRHYYAGSFSVTNGITSYTNDAQPGTVVFVDIAEPGMMLTIR